MTPAGPPQASREQALAAEVAQLRAKLKEYQTLHPPGHFYSPIARWEQLEPRAEQIFRTFPKEIPGIDLNLPRQRELLRAFAEFYPSQPFGEEPTPRTRYGYKNPSFGIGDALVYHCMIRHLRPRRLVEVGSGNSSCVAMDTDQIFLGSSLQATFIDPYSKFLRSKLRPGDADRYSVVERPVQDVELGVFEALEPGDILFIDSTHVSKPGSDVHRLVFDVLPRLRPGVYVHIHDILHPFEYPEHWVKEGRAWNEAYLVRAFLQYNSAFTVQFFNSYARRFLAEETIAAIPLFLQNPGGSLWLRREAGRTA